MTSLFRRKKIKENKKIEYILPELLQMRGIIESIELPLVVIKLPELLQMRGIIESLAYTESNLAGRLISSMRARVVDIELEKERKEKIEEIKKRPKETWIA